MTSALVTIASLTLTPLSDTTTETASPFRVTTSPLERDELGALAATTWYRRRFASSSLFSGRSSASSVSSGILANASSVGAIEVG